MAADVTYLPDETIDAATDAQLRRVLRACYREPRHEVFERQRYFNQPYPHRWIVRDQAGTIVAQLGIHERTFDCDGVSYRFGGVGDVCVHPDHRGNGYVRDMIAAAHDFLRQRDYPFGMLFGNPQVYGSSGYRRADNVLCNMAMESNTPGEWRPVHPLICELADTPWPTGTIHMPGPTF